VGLQLLKTGQRENHINISQINHFFWDDFHKNSFDLDSKPNFKLILFHKSGNKVIIQNKIIIIQEMLVNISLLNHIKSVLAFNAKEKIIIEIESENIIIKDFLLLFLSQILLHNIIGKSGKTHGASIVKIPEKNEINNIAINDY